MMHKTTIRLTDEQYKAAIEAASDKGIPLAEYVRDLVSKDLDLDLGSVRAFHIPDGRFSRGHLPHQAQKTVGLSTAAVNETLRIIRQGRIIGAIKYVRETTACGLWDAKQVVDKLRTETE